MEMKKEGFEYDPSDECFSMVVFVLCANSAEPHSQQTTHIHSLNKWLGQSGPRALSILEPRSRPYDKAYSSLLRTYVHKMETRPS